MDLFFKNISLLFGYEWFTRNVVNTNYYLWTSPILNHINICIYISFLTTTSRVGKLRNCIYCIADIMNDVNVRNRTWCVYKQRRSKYMDLIMDETWEHAMLYSDISTVLTRVSGNLSLNEPACCDILTGITDIGLLIF